MPAKSTGHRKTGTEPKEVNDDPMMTTRVKKKQQRWTTVKAHIFFSTLLSIRTKKRQQMSRKEKANRNQ
jgi:hypothetical protein